MVRRRRGLASILVLISTFVVFTRLVSFCVLGPGLSLHAHDVAGPTFSLLSKFQRTPILIPAVFGPALAMALGGLSGGRLKVSNWGLCASQYLSAGMILAVCSSLVKEIAERGVGAALALATGFALGVATMVVVKKITEDTSEMDQQTIGDAEQKPKTFPWPLVFAVAIDSFVDGLLLGMIANETPHAVRMMAAATALEMGALGLSFSASLTGQRKDLHFACIFGMPLMLVGGGLIGALCGEALQQSPLALTGMLAFGIAALLYLVTQELLCEATELSKELNDRGMASYCLFVGYVFVLVIGLFE